jgi:four helix bundle protein
MLPFDRRFPHEEAYGMTAQIHRASASIAASIAEGHGTEMTGSFVQFLRMSQGSLKELETHLLAARGGITEASATEPILDRCEALGKMLRRLIRSLRDDHAASDTETRHSPFATRHSLAQQEGRSGGNP